MASLQNFHNTLKVNMSCPLSVWYIFVRELTRYNSLQSSKLHISNILSAKFKELKNFYLKEDKSKNYF